MYEKNNIYKTDAVKGLKKLPNNFVDMVLSSPPYGEIRDYNGFKWDFEATAKQLYRVTKPGGVVVWVVGDQVIDDLARVLVCGGQGVANDRHPAVSAAAA